MKKIIILGLAAAMALFSTDSYAAEGWFSKKLKANGKKITETRTSAMRFSQIKVSRNIILIVEERTTGDITVTADENIMPYVEMEVHDGVFRANLSNDITLRNGSANIYVRMPYNGKINDIEVSGASSVTVIPRIETQEFKASAHGASVLKVNVKADKFQTKTSGSSNVNITATADEVELYCSGASKLTADVTAGDVYGEVSGASKATLKGKAQNASYESSGASSLDAEDLVTEECTVECSGASIASVNCTSSLKAEASGASKITYTGDCELVNKSTTGASSIYNKIK